MLLNNFLVVQSAAALQKKKIAIQKAYLVSCVNSRVDDLAEVIDDHDGYLTFSNGSDTSDDFIDYHRSYQDVYTVNWCDEEVKVDAEKLSAFVKQMVS